MKKSLFIFSSLSALLAVCVACSEIPKEAYYAHGQPENLLETSKKDVSFSLGGKSSLDKVTNWVTKNHPKEARLQCREDSTPCNKLERWLVRRGITVTRATSRQNSAIFAYTVIRARDCENRYIDNMINPYNLNHPTFGCSLAANSAQMVTDRREFTDPPLQDDANGRKAAQAVDIYNTPVKATPDFAPLVSSTGGSGGGSR